MAEEQEQKSCLMLQHQTTGAHQGRKGSAYMRNYKHYNRYSKESKTFPVVAVIILMIMVIFFILMACGMFDEPLWQEVYPMANAKITWTGAGYSGI